MLLFVYGLLKPGERDSEKLGKYVDKGKDVIYGDMYDLGSEPAAIRLGLPIADIIIGYVVDIDPGVIKALDRFEGRKYRRRKSIETLSGREVEVYEWTSRVPKEALDRGRIREWRA